MSDKKRAIEKLMRKFPDARRLFGDHPTADHFEILLHTDDIEVLEDDSCWIIVEKHTGGTGGYVHWFCPHGARIKAIRRMLSKLFASGYKTLSGHTPPEKEYARQARWFESGRWGQEIRRFVCFDTGPLSRL